MSYKTKYLLDANVFIEAYQRYYAFDIVPSFWKSLRKLAEAEKIISIDRIKNEIMQGGKNDELSNWAQTDFEEWFMTTDDARVFESYSSIIQWVQSNEQFLEHAVSEFASVADSWLIAYALTYNHTIVTHEEHKKDVRKRVLIPNVCKVFDIPYINTFNMLRNLQTTF